MFTRYLDLQDRNVEQLAFIEEWQLGIRDLLREYQADHPDLFIGIFAPSLYQVIFDE